MPGYHETCLWNLWWGVGEIICSLQKMDQRVVQQIFNGPLRTMKLNNAKCKQKNIRILTLETAYSCVLCPQSNSFAHTDQTQTKGKD